MSTRRLVIALGGNAIKQADERGTTEEQFRNIVTTCRQIVKILEKDPDMELAITHGNGPQVGNLLLQQEKASDAIPAQTLDVLNGMTQGQIGYMLQQTLQNSLREAGGKLGRRQVISIVNQVLVSRDDPDFLDPSKPIGNFFTKAEAERLAAEEGYVINPPAGKKYLDKKMKGMVIKQVKPANVTPRPFRRVVPSPEPIRNVEAEVIRLLVEQGIIVIASGGGGIPVIMNEQGRLEGVFAVIDKDKAGEKMASAIKATDFLILSDVEYAMLNFGKENQKPIRRISVREAEKYLSEGHFLAGSMGPKVVACIRFLKNGGRRAIITSLHKAAEALEGRVGTHLYR
ncbi:carbamate kinase [Candidatus Hecatella orcuttiae]|jgi:carbamate kinase|uniref:carbamate kinase n=1 Tax=Candidatus Hecatella orcuttiae TaxID=1935119 RepID=UPI002867CC44|nr:carbamate kinase [Candidatus Hecatella orcuttiae]